MFSGGVGIPCSIIGTCIDKKQTFYTSEMDVSFFLIISRQISKYFILWSIIPVLILQVSKIEHLKKVSSNFIFNFLISISTTISISKNFFLMKCVFSDNFISISFNPLWGSLWKKKVLKMFTQNIHKKFNHFYKWPDNTHFSILSWPFILNYKSCNTWTDRFSMPVLTIDPIRNQIFTLYRTIMLVLGQVTFQIEILFNFSNS